MFKYSKCFQENSFDENDIPTITRPIQMNIELEEYCKNEINDLPQKKLIRVSKSQWCY